MTNSDRKFKLGTINIRYAQILLKTFYEDRTICLCTGTQKNSNTLKSMGKISYSHILAYFDCTKRNKMNVHFSSTLKRNFQQNMI